MCSINSLHNQQNALRMMGMCQKHIDNFCRELQDLPHAQVERAYNHYKNLKKVGGDPESRQFHLY
jgi:hypothetical protein